MTRNKILLGGALLAALFLILFLIPASSPGTGPAAKRTSLLGRITDSVGERFSSEPAIETLAGYNETHYRALPEKEKAAYRDYLVRLDKDVTFLKMELKEDKPRFDAILQTLYGEQMQSLNRPHAVIGSVAANTPEGIEFMKKQAIERQAGGEVMKIDLLQETLIRFGPRLTREEKKKIESEIGTRATSLGH